MNETMTILKLMLECIASGKLEGHVFSNEVLHLAKLAFPLLTALHSTTLHEELMRPWPEDLPD